jgi:hypothetical protein
MTNLTLRLHPAFLTGGSGMGCRVKGAISFEGGEKMGE